MLGEGATPLIDDLDGTRSETVRTVYFELDEVSYEINLDEAHARTLRATLADFIAHARPATYTDD